MKTKNKQIVGPLSDACKAFAAFTKDQHYYEPSKANEKKKVRKPKKFVERGRE